jgi:hypothetical protein
MHGNEDPFAQMIVPVYSRVDSRNQIIPTLSKKTGIDSKLFSDPKVYARIGGRNNTQEITLFRITYQAQPVINQTAGDLAWTSKHGASDLWMTTPADILALILNTYK